MIDTQAKTIHISNLYYFQLNYHQYVYDLPANYQLYEENKLKYEGQTINHAEASLIITKQIE